MNIRGTERRISQKTNIHGLETPEELLEKYKIKINDVYLLISKGIIEALNKKPEERQKNIYQIQRLNTATNIEIKQVLELDINENIKKNLEEIRKKINENINENAKIEILKKMDYCRSILTEVIEIENTNKAKTYEKHLQELAIKIRTNKENIIEVISLIQEKDFSTDIRKQLEGFETYVKIYYIDEK